MTTCITFLGGIDYLYNIFRWYLHDRNEQIAVGEEERVTVGSIGM